MSCASRIIFVIVKALLASGANVDSARTSDGDTPLSAATRHKHSHVVNQLMNAGKEENSMMLKILRS